MSSEGWKEAVVEEWRKRRNAERKPPSMGFPLISNTTGEEELLAIETTSVTLSQLVKDQASQLDETRVAREAAQEQLAERGLLLAKAEAKLLVERV